MVLCDQWSKRSFVRTAVDVLNIVSVNSLMCARRNLFFVMTSTEALNMLSAHVHCSNFAFF